MCRVSRSPDTKLAPPVCCCSRPWLAAIQGREGRQPRWLSGIFYILLKSGWGVASLSTAPPREICADNIIAGGFSSPSLPPSKAIQTSDTEAAGWFPFSGSESGNERLHWVLQSRVAGSDLDFSPTSSHLAKFATSKPRFMK